MGSTSFASWFTTSAWCWQDWVKYLKMASMSIKDETKLWMMLIAAC
jgi:hypothetical protein